MKWVQTKEDETFHVTKDLENLLCMSPGKFIITEVDLTNQSSVCQICYVKSIHELASLQGMRIKKLEVKFTEDGERYADVDVVARKTHD